MKSSRCRQAAFCHFVRNKVEIYRNDAVKSMRKRMAPRGAFRFSYDIGPGYITTYIIGRLVREIHMTQRNWRIA